MGIEDPPRPEPRSGGGGQPSSVVFILEEKSAFVFNAVSLEEPKPILKRSHVCSRRFAAGLLESLIPWAHAHGYMLMPLRGILRAEALRARWNRTWKAKPSLDCAQPAAAFSQPACWRRPPLDESPFSISQTDHEGTGGSAAGCSGPMPGDMRREGAPRASDQVHFVTRTTSSD